MIIDGMTNDVHGNRGFFAEGIDLIAWDSIAAHNRGLQSLSSLWRQGRGRTTTEPISLPYRHGILHGRDLSYDSKLVAAKCWAALFSLREWAIAVRDGRTQEPPSEPEPTLGETFEEHLWVRSYRTKVEEWKPRDEKTLASILRSGAPGEYETGTPERTLAELMDYWKRRNYGYLAKLLHLPGEEGSLGQRAKEIRQILDTKNLLVFKIVETRDEAPAITTCKIEIGYEKVGEKFEKSIDLHFLYLDKKGFPVLRGSPEGVWQVAGLHIEASGL